jgi:hypothetical protein
MIHFVVRSALIQARPRQQLLPSPWKQKTSSLRHCFHPHMASLINTCRCMITQGQTGIWLTGSVSACKLERLRVYWFMECACDKQEELFGHFNYHVHANGHSVVAVVIPVVSNSCTQTRAARLAHAHCYCPCCGHVVRIECSAAHASIRLYAIFAELCPYVDHVRTYP